jgi:outer membrane protein assembly factor BamB
VTPHHSSIQYPGGLHARYRWTGPSGVDAFGPTEASGALIDLGSLAGAESETLCRAELRAEGPLGDWTVRFASAIFDEPRGVYWDVPGLLAVAYGFTVYALRARSGELAWHWKSGTPIVAVLASSRLDHLLAQSEVETVAFDANGAPVWRVAHSDVVAEAEIVGGSLVLTSFGGQHQVLDPATGIGRNA